MSRSIVCIIALAAAGGSLAQSQGYPVKPIRIIVPQAPGGGSDTIARLVGAEITRAWGQQVIVENRTGGNGMIGTEYVTKQAPDGYTILVNELGGTVIRPILFPRASYDPATDLAGVAMVAYGANVLVVHPSLPVRSMQDLVRLARARPGQLNFAVPGIGSVAHLAGVEIERLMGVQWTYIPYKGGGPAVLEVIAGQTDFGINGLLAAYPHIRNGRLRVLAVASKGRHPALPEVPTFAETVRGNPSGSSQGIAAPAGTPPEIIAKWNAEVARINAMPAIREKLAALGAVPDTMTAEQVQQFLVSEKARWTKVVREGKVKAE